MSNDSPPKEYKYKLNAEDFVKLFLSDDSEFDGIKAEMLAVGKNGVNSIQRNNHCNILLNVEIIGKIEISRILKENCAQLLGINVKLDKFRIHDSQLIANRRNRLSFHLEKSYINSLVLENSFIGYFSIKDCSVTDFKISNSRTINIQITKSTILKARVDNSTTQNILIEESIIEAFHFYFSTSINFRIFKQSTIGFFCVQGETINELQILDSNIKQFDATELFCSLLIKSSIVPFLYLFDCSIIEFRIALFCKMSVNITRGQINKIDFQKTGLNPETSISFSKTRIYSILMEEFSMLGNLYFRQIIKAEKPFEWYNYENNIVTLLDLDQGLRSHIFEQRKNQYDLLRKNYDKNCENLEKEFEKATFRISQSSLGKTEFTDCPLAEFRFEFNNSKITDCFVSGDSIPTKNVHVFEKEPNSIEEHQQKASFFNQFKKIFEAQGDIYHATQFQAKWADEQRKLLELIHKGEKGLFNSTFSDLWILKLNKWSNLHGESWPRAFGWIMGLGLVFYLLYLLSIERLFNTNKLDLNLIGYYFEFLNPAHKFNFINEGNIASGWTVFTDVAWRIIVAYLIYQFIAAFRKHTKKQ